VPIGIFRWKLEKELFETVLAAASTWGGEEGTFSDADLVRALDEEGSIPLGMVRVPATETEVGALGDFFVGRYGVTDREYKDFVDARGYRNRGYWRLPFVREGRRLTWEEAIREFVDQN
jgi:formylglycine-generating enzyme required for sulfatase activity